MNCKWVKSFRRACHGLLGISVIAMSVSLFAAPTVTTGFNAGWQAYEQGDYTRAAKIWTSLAERGHANAQINLGFMYDYGKGVAQDFGRAAKWYRAAAQQNSAVGQYNLAILIEEGKTEPVEGRTARYWLQLAAAQGYEEAKRELGNRREAGAIQEVSVEKQTGTNFRETKAYADRSSVSVGTAWPIAAGYAVTNHHVINGKRSVTLVNRDGSEITAHVIASDQTHDIAFLRVSDPGLLPPALPFSRSRATLGTSVFTIGYPRIDVMGKTPKLSQGIISGVNGLRDDPTSYQISVPIQPGNSGGPLLNMRGEVVGMITAMLGSVQSEDGTAQPIPNINYALKVDVIKRFLDQVPRSETDIAALIPASNNLEGLAARIQDSVLIVMAE